MRRSGTSSTTRLGNPFKGRCSENRVDQRSSATDTTRHDEPSLSEQWKDEYISSDAERPSHLSGLYSGERMNAATVEHLLPLESTFNDSDRNRLRFPRNQDLGAPRPDVIAYVPAPCWKINALSAIGQAVLDLCIAATPFWFIVLGIMAVLNSGKAQWESIVPVIMNAARFVSPSCLSRYFGWLTDWS
jgi:hypothetical protein